MAKHKRRARRHAKNTFKGHSRLHAAAARKGWRRHARNPHKKHRKGHRKHRGFRALMHNPMQALTGKDGVVKSSLSAFNFGTLAKGGTVVGGVIANEYASDYLGMGLEKLAPSINFGHGIPSYLTGLVSAGLLGYGTKLVAPKYAGLVFLGGVIQVVKKVADDYLTPHLPALPAVGPVAAPVMVHPAAAAPAAAAPAAGVSGMGDWLTPQNAATARALHGFGDYLTPGNARTARPLGDFASMAVASELETM
jgi:hypothetical protein